MFWSGVLLQARSGASLRRKDCSRRGKKEGKGIPRGRNAKCTREMRLGYRTPRSLLAFQKLSRSRVFVFAVFSFLIFLKRLEAGRRLKARRLMIFAAAAAAFDLSGFFLESIYRLRRWIIKAECSRTTQEVSMNEWKDFLNQVMSEKSTFV